MLLQQLLNLLPRPLKRLLQNDLRVVFFFKREAQLLLRIWTKLVVLGLVLRVPAVVLPPVSESLVLDHGQSCHATAFLKANESLISEEIFVHIHSEPQREGFVSHFVPDPLCLAVKEEVAILAVVKLVCDKSNQFVIEFKLSGARSPGTKRSKATDRRLGRCGARFSSGTGGRKKANPCK